MKTNKFIGIIQPKYSKNKFDSSNDLFRVDALKITSFEKTDGRFLIELKGVIRFDITKEIESQKNIVNVKYLIINIMMILLKKRRN